MLVWVDARSQLDSLDLVVDLVVQLVEVANEGLLDEGLLGGLVCRELVV